LKKNDATVMIDKNGRRVYKNSLAKYHAAIYDENGALNIPQIWISHIQNISYDRGKGSEITLRMYDDWMKNPYEIEVIDDTPESIMLAIFEGAILKGYK
jgi:hypothetical protein